MSRFRDGRSRDRRYFAAATNFDASICWIAWRLWATAIWQIPGFPNARGHVRFSTEAEVQDRIETGLDARVGVEPEI